MRRTSRIEAKNVFVTHRFYPSSVRFEGDIPHGKSTRQIAVDVPPELILKIADALRATTGACAGDLRDGIGHAIWHVHHPEHVMPCLDHSKVIDLDALPAGSAGDDAGDGE